MKKFKIKIHNEDHSKAVQDRLFDLGYSWYTKGEYQHLYATCFLCENMRLMVCNDEKGFVKDPLQELTLDDLYQINKDIEVDLGNNVIARIQESTVNIDGKDYTHGSIIRLTDAIIDYRK